MNKSRFGLVTFTALAVMLLAPPGGPASAETLEEAVQTALATHPRIDVLSRNRAATEQELKQAKSFWQPSVDLYGSIGGEWANTPSTRVLLGDDWSDEVRYEGRVTLSQLIYDFGATDGEIQRQRARSRGAAKRVAETAEFLGLDTVEAYLEVLRHRALVDIAAQTVKAHERILDDINQRRTGGAGTRGDVEQVKSRLEQARAAESTAIRALREAEAFYGETTGNAPGTLSRPSTGLAMVPAHDDLLVSVRENNPTVVALWEDVYSYEGQLRSAKSSYYPRFSFEFSATKGHDIRGPFGRDDDITALVVMRWNLYRGGADMARIAEFKERMAQATAQVSVAQREAEREARITWAAMVAAEERARYFAEAARANEQVVDVYRDQFRLGQRTLLDLLDAENELFIARSQQVSADYGHIFSQYRLLAVEGKLLDALNVAPPVAADPSSVR